MRYLAVFFFALFVSFLAAAENDSCSFISPDNDCPLKGKVRIVNNFEDLKVEIVDCCFEDIAIDVVDTYWEDSGCGKIELVENFEDIKIRVVKDFADIKIRFRNKESKERFMKAFKSIK